MRLSIAAMALAIATPVDAAPSTAPATFVYCSAASISPRGRGLIVTAIFRSRTDIEFIKSAFTNYLRTSYAPYGNGWVVPEHGVTCLDFIDQRKAELRRSLDISRIPQPAQSIFDVPFQLG